MKSVPPFAIVLLILVTPFDAGAQNECCGGQCIRSLLEHVLNEDPSPPPNATVTPTKPDTAVLLQRFSENPVRVVQLRLTHGKYVLDDGDHRISGTSVPALALEWLNTGTKEPVIYVDTSSLPAYKGEAFVSSLRMTPSVRAAQVSIRSVRNLSPDFDVAFIREPSVIAHAPETRYHRDGRVETSIRVTTPSRHGIVIRIVGRVQSAVARFVQRVLALLKGGDSIERAVTRARTELKDTLHLGEHDLTVLIRAELAEIQIVEHWTRPARTSICSSAPVRGGFARLAT